MHFVNRFMCFMATATLSVFPLQTTKAQNCAASHQLGVPVAITLNSNKPFVPESINGAGPVTSILDTGSTRGSIDSQMAKSFRLHAKSVEKETGAGAASVDTAQLDPTCQSLGGGSLTAPMGAFDLTGISQVEGRAVQGLLGGDFFSHFVIRLDYDQKNVTVYAANYEYRGNGVIVPLTFDDGHAFTTATLRTRDGKVATGKFLIDTGARGALSLNGPFAAAHGLPLRTEPQIQATTGVGVGGETRGLVFRMDAFDLGGIHMHDVLANVSTDKGGFFTDPNVAGIIGADILSRFRVWIDYPHSRLILERTATSTEQFDFDASGMFLLGKGPHFNRITVFRVVPGSPAELAGIRAGDILLSIADKSTDVIGLDNVRKLLRVPGRVDRATFTRHGSSNSVMLHTRDLLAAPN